MSTADPQTIHVRIPTPLRAYTDNRHTVTVSGQTVAEALSDLTERHPALREHLYNEKGQLRSFVNIYVGDEDIRYQNGEETPLHDEAELSIVPSIAGGVSGVSTRAVSLSNEELRRYSRHLILPEVGMEGQRRLKAASVLLVGAGGLGSPLAMYLAAAGVGRLGIVDFDVVDESNLQRQVLHGTQDLGRPKLASARDRLHDLNPHVQVDLHGTRLTSENALEIVGDYDLVADGTDNFPTRYLVNDACVLTGTPNVYASIFRFEGQASVFGLPEGPCYRCIYEEPPPPGLVPSCAEGGVLGVLPGLVGTIQATEVIKLICGIGEPLVGRLLLIDALEMRFRTLKLRKNPQCPVCGENRTIHTLIDYEAFCGLPPAGGNGQQEEAEVPEITVQELKARRDRGDAPFLLDVRKPFEYEIANLDGTLIPVDDLPERLEELAPYREEEIVVHCKSGARSARAVRLLQEAGFRQAYNLKGGILAWSKEIDPAVPSY